MTSKFILDAFPALGTLWWIEIFEDIELSKEKKFSELLKKEILNFEDSYSRFKTSSEITKLNNDRQIISPSSDFYEMCRLGMEFCEITEGIFNLCVGGNLEKLGYGNLFNEDKLQDEFIDMREILHVTHDKISLSKEGYNLDFGGIGKGYLIEKIKNILLDNNFQYFLINGGGDIYATSNNKKPIEVFLEDPLNDNMYIGSILLLNSALAVSSPHKRKWIFNDKLNTHIVSKNKNQKFYSSFVISESIISADSLATCFCINPFLFKNTNNLVKSYLVLDDENTVVNILNFNINE